MVKGSETVPTGVERIGAQAVWDKNKDKTVDIGGNAGDASWIAIIDTGLWNDSSGNPHIDLPESCYSGYVVAWNDATQSVDIYSREPVGDFDYLIRSHGTKVAGVVAAADNDIGVIGVSCHVGLNVYALSSVNAPPEDDEKFANELAAAIHYAADDDKIDVISISLGIHTDYSCLRNACVYAYQSGKLLVCAAGNDNGSLRYPAAYCSVFPYPTIAVGAVYDNGTLWELSNYSTDCRYFTAPGVFVNTTTYENGYGLFNGTSLACPHFSAAAALVYSSTPDPLYNYDGNLTNWSPDEVVDKLRDTCRELDGGTYGSPSGHKLVNANLASQTPRCDINNDNLTNAKDAVLLGKLFGTNTSSNEWNRMADLNIDDFVNAKDSVIMGWFFGWTSNTTESRQSGVLTNYGTKLKIQPASNTFYTDTTGVGQNFTIAIIAENVTDLYGWELGLSWTPGLINCTTETINYNVWSYYLGPWVNSSVNNANGTYYQSLTARAPSASYNGTTWLANLTFTIVQAPPEGGTFETDLTLSGGPGCTYCMLNSNAEEIPHDFVQGSYAFISARYMRSDQHIVNGLQAYKLNTTQSASSKTVNLTEYESNTAYWGIRVWKRASNGTETEVTSGTPVAQVNRSQNGYGIQSATWNCPNASLALTDSIVVRAYCKNGGDWTLQAAFTTAQLNSQKTKASTWTVYYWTQRTYTLQGGIGKTIAYYKWGSPSYNSRIHNLATES